LRKPVRISAIIVFIGWLLTGGLQAQGLFEQSVSGGDNQAWSLSGYIRGLAWAGKTVDKENIEPKALFSGGEINLLAKSGKFGDGKLSFRLRDGMENGYEPYGLDLREAYIHVHLGPVSLCTGRQIIAWGRADSNNPTDLITPKNPLFHSPDPDDIRMGNFLFNGKINVGTHIFFQGIWIPVYRPSIIPVTRDVLPPEMEVPAVQSPQKTLKNSGYAMKMDFTYPAVDFSLSWFDGFDPYPLFSFGGYKPVDSTFVPVIGEEPFREKIAGADFSTTLGSFGVRGEVAYRQTKGYDHDIHVALPDIRWVAGLDKTLGNLTMIVQYSGYCVTKFREVPEPGSGPAVMPDQMLLFYNRLMFRQTKRSQHTLSLHATWSPGQENVNIEGYGETNLTTGESLIRAQVKWNVSDGLSLTGGWQHFDGKQNTLYDLVGPLLNGLYMQCKICF